MTTIPTPDMERVVAALEDALEPRKGEAQNRRYTRMYGAIKSSLKTLQILRQHADAPAGDVDEAYRLERHDEEDGSIVYEIWCLKPHYCVVQISDFLNDHAKRDAERIVTLLTAQPDTRREGLVLPDLPHLSSVAFSWNWQCKEWFCSLLPAIPGPSLNGNGPTLHAAAIDALAKIKPMEGE